MELTSAFQAVVISLFSALLSFWGVSRLHRWAEDRKILDIPNDRSSHTKPTPRGGGLAIVLVSIVGMVIAWLVYPIWSVGTLFGYVLGGILIATVGWMDDVRPLAYRIRLAGHILVAFIAILGFGYCKSINLPLLGQISLGWLGIPITFIWVVGLINAFNFMDGIDGIAGGQAVVGGIGWAVVGWLSGLTLISALGLLLAAASLGFLVHNWPPSRIFMGDVGSTFLGYTFAILPVSAAQNDSRFALLGALFVWPFLFDTAFTFSRRLRNGENVFEAHRSHLYQRLVVIGYSHRFVSIFYIGMTFLGIVLSLIWFQNIGGSSLAVALGMPLLCICLWAFVRTQEKRRISRPQSTPSPTN
jgi:UDP-N-acetylmuramyl pentapeptide phosphotransferase/UDP-N-acetylglucosamine-1-phosphate transferase